MLVKDESKFAKKIPLILRTRTLDYVVENLLESEEDELSTTWKTAKVVHSLAKRFQELGCHAPINEGELELENHKCFSNKGIPDLLSHEEIMCTAKMEYFHPHFNTIIKGQTQLVLCGTKINVMTEAIRQDDSPLLRGAHVQPVFTEYNMGNQQVSIELYNTKDVPIWIPKGTPITHKVAVNIIPQTIMVDSSEVPSEHDDH